MATQDFHPKFSVINQMNKFLWKDTTDTKNRTLQATGFKAREANNDDDDLSFPCVLSIKRIK
jgi:hypothetical protein